MKKRVSSFLMVLFLFISVSAQPQWTWVHGSNVVNTPGNYGVVGVSNSTNEPPARYEAGEWEDSQGNLWIYGGIRPTGAVLELSDLWMYNPVMNEWVWISGSNVTGQPISFGVTGVPSATNTPGARGWGMITWVDSNDNLWLFGGSTNSSNPDYLNDLWMFNTTTMMWTYYGGTLPNTGGVYGIKGISSALNWPGCRYESDAAWVDALGNFWIFGGHGFDKNNTFGRMNDLWKYDPLTQEWTWMSGDDLANQSAVFGLKGIAASTNKPGGLSNSFTSWKNPTTGNFYIMGGYHISGTNPGFMNDVWMYDPTSNIWTWTSGDGAGALVPGNGNLGVQCLPSINNSPPSTGLFESRARWVDDCGNLWVYLGNSYNTLMRYSMATNEWTWVNGTNVSGNAAVTAPVYGVKGVGAATNSPGWRVGPNALKIKGKEDLYLFGGGHFVGAFTPPNFYGDLWKYTPEKPTAIFTHTVQPSCSSVAVSFTGQSNPGCNEIKSYQWNFGDVASGALNTSTIQNPSHNYSASGGYTVKLIITNCTGSKDSTSVNINLNVSIATASLSSTAATCSGVGDGSALVVSNTGQAPYTYNWSDGSTTATITNLFSGLYSITITDATNCLYTSSVSVAEPPPLAFQLTTTSITCNGVSDGEIQVNVSGGTSPYSFLWSNNSTLSLNTGLNAGVYSFTITDDLGCKKDTLVNIVAPSSFTINENVFSAQCGLSNGIINTNVLGGTSPYLYLWSNGQTTADISNLSAGNYTLTILDQKNCITTKTIVLTGSNTLIPTVSSLQHVSCFSYFDGSIYADANGGTSPYNYQWSNLATTSSITNISAGIYNLTVTDNNGCSGVLANIQINQPPQLTIAVSVTNVCFGNSASVTAAGTGGTGNINYLWDNGITSAIVSGINVSGVYSVTVIDMNGCTASNSANVIVYDQPAVSFSTDTSSGCDLLCVNFIANAPTAVNYQWNFGNDSTAFVANPTMCFSSGSYSVSLEIIDNNGCTTLYQSPSSIEVHPKPTSIFEIIPKDPSQLNPNITAVDQSLGATAWLWSFGDFANSSSTLQEPSFTFNDTGLFCITQIVRNEFFCYDTSEYCVEVKPDFSFYMPNAFTPNDDGVNDVFFPKVIGVNIDTYEFKIFDRWGDLIFESTNPLVGWNGIANKGKKVAQNDTYVWKVVTKDIFGMKHRYVGQVNLIK